MSPAPETVTAAEEAAALAAVPRGLLIDGEWHQAGSGATFVVDDPATGASLMEVADAGPDEATAALDAACAAGPGWAATPPRLRADALWRLHDAVVAATEDLALLITLEMGKPLGESRGEVAYAAAFIRWYAEEATRIDGRYTRAPEGGSRLLVTMRPVGPCYFVTPWNFPIAMLTRKVAPALAAGCTVVCKPAEQTPLTALAFADLVRASDIPSGVVNVITTTDPAGVSDALLGDRRLRKVSFTGSTEVGRRIVAASATNLLRVSMELGGDAPFLVFADADLDAAVEGAMLAKLRNGGEACTAANRFLVHESVADAFAERLAERFAGLRVGRGTEPGMDVGPLIDDDGRAKVASAVAAAVAAGADVRIGGDAVDGPGYFYAPTVLSGVGDVDGLRGVELFGPVAPIRAFGDDDEAFALANDTDYGLVAYAYTRDLRRTMALPERLEVGMIGVNRGLVSNAAAPFGGVKHSGFGREGGPEGLREYLETTYLAIDES